MFRNSNSVLCWLLALTTAAAPSAVYGQDAAGAKAHSAAPYVTARTAFAAMALPRQLLSSPQLSMLPIEVFTAVGMQNMGIDPLDIEWVLLAVAPPENEDAETSEVGLVLKFAKPYDRNLARSKLRKEYTEAAVEGKTYYRLPKGMQPAIAMPDDRTLLVGTDNLLEHWLTGKLTGGDNPLTAKLAAAGEDEFYSVVVLDGFRSEIKKAREQAPPLPPPLAKLLDIPDLVKTAEGRWNLTNGRRSEIALQAKDAASADRLEGLINQGLDMGRQMLLAQLAQEAAQAPDDPVQQASIKYMQRVSGKMVEMLRPERDGDRLVLGGKAGQGDNAASVATIGILVALLLPAIQAAREAARRIASINNMKQIGLAMLNHHDVYKRLPPQAITDKEGKPLLSWRVKILPFIEENELYEQFHLDEPWDSEHNIKLVEKMPSSYMNPSFAGEPGKTNYLALVGEGLAFAPPAKDDKGRQIRDFRDGTSKSILVVEADADRAVVWTKPEDLTVNPKKPLDGLGGFRAGDFFLALFADSHVTTITLDLDADDIMKLFTISGGEPNPRDF